METLGIANNPQHVARHKFKFGRGGDVVILTTLDCHQQRLILLADACMHQLLADEG